MLRRQEGQAVVEAAIVLPAMVFLILMTIQLTLLQQARIMVEYAAFAAARTGIVANGDNGSGADILTRGLNGKMHDAAVLAILPTFGNTTTLANIESTRLRFLAQEGTLRGLGLGQVKVFVHNPVATDFDGELGNHLHNEEIDFDDVRPEAAEATLLSVQVRYLFQLTVPFANQMLQAIYLAGHAKTLIDWSKQSWDMTRIGDSGTPVIDDGMGGVPVIGLKTAAGRQQFFLPVYAWYTMRMQSNPYKRWAR
jgi:hypothetical protein